MIIKMRATVYYVVNTSLGMSAGKIAAQCCHVNTDIIRSMLKTSKLPKIYLSWKSTGETTVVLGADEEQFNAIFEEFKDQKVDSSFRVPHMRYQTDAGRTEVKPGTITVLGFTPMFKHEAPECIKSLKTFK